MENASKALLIAGAILLVILIISLGLMVFNQAKSSVGSANLNQQEMEAFNSKFTPYEGASVPGSQVNALIQAVISSNQAENIAGTNRYVVTGSIPGGGSINAAGGAAPTVTSPARVIPGNTYSVTCTYTNGLVTAIAINVAGAPAPTPTPTP